MDQFASKRALAAGAESPEALRALAAEHGVSLTGEEAWRCFTRLHPPTGALSDAELEAVSGGGCGGGGAAGSSGFMARGYQFAPCPQCGHNYWSLKFESTVSLGRTRYVWECDVCYHRARSGGGDVVPSCDTMYDASKVETPREAWFDG